MNSILVLDNYDSFTYNLVYLLRKLQADFKVCRNDKIVVSDIQNFIGILLSPGPGIPSEAGRMPEVITRYAGKIPILGICLGHQAIAESAGGKLNNMAKVYHGVQTPILLKAPSLIFKNVPQQFRAGRYHSWEIDKHNIPAKLRITAEDKYGSVMAIEHSDFPLYGFQFHPESVMTAVGMTLLKNFLEICQSRHYERSPGTLV